MHYILTIITSIAFISYGLLCLFTRHMESEFKRYGLSKFRLLTGLLELLGGVGLLVGYYFYRPLFTLSALGLAVLMFLGVFVRIRVKDHYFQILPALMFLIFNIYLLIGSDG